MDLGPDKQLIFALGLKIRDLTDTRWATRWAHNAYLLLGKLAQILYVLCVWSNKKPHFTFWASALLQYSFKIFPLWGAYFAS